MNDSGFFARVRSDAERVLPDYDRRSPPAPASPSVRARSSAASRRTRTPAARDAGTAPASASASIERDEQPGHTESDPVAAPTDTREDTGSPGRIRHSKASGVETRHPAPTDSGHWSLARSSPAAAEVESPQSVQRKDAGVSFEPEAVPVPTAHNAGVRPVTDGNRHRSTPAPAGQARFTENLSTATTAGHEPPSIGESTESATPAPTPDRDRPPLPERPHAAENRPAPGREQTETPTPARRVHPGAGDTGPSRLHIGEVLIRVEAEPKPRRAKREQRGPTPSDSRRLIRSL